MECVGGLADLLRNRPLTPEEAARLAKAIIGAVLRLGGTQVPHHDLKPSHLFITALGEVKLLDFGLLWDLKSAGRSSSCTFAYASPEQVEKRNLDLKSDLFSLGLILYELVRGGRMFFSNSTQSYSDYLACRKERLKAPIGLPEMLEEALEPERSLMNGPVIVFEGHATIDGFLAPEVGLEFLEGGVDLRHASRPEPIFVRTEEEPRPGSKVMAMTSLASLAASPLVSERRPAGGAVNAAAALADARRAAGRRGTVRLINTGTETPELADLCRRRGVELISLGRRKTPISVIARCGNDRLILKDPSRPPRGPSLRA
jgi:serine/threonine protein kinase